MPGFARNAAYKKALLMREHQQGSARREAEDK